MEKPMPPDAAAIPPGFPHALPRSMPDRLAHAQSLRPMMP
jgi:hypothetical protein